MSKHNFESQPEGDWDDKGDISWNEIDWQRFLTRQENEVARFLKIYDNANTQSLERLDWVARQMGWDTDDWSISDFPEEEDELEADDVWKQKDELQGQGPTDFDPYTLHRHPVYVVSSGLLINVRYIWKHAIELRKGHIDNSLSWEFAESLSEIEKHILMALQSMEMGDYLLCVVHLKRALRGVNLSLQILPNIQTQSQIPAAFIRKITVRVFDLREVCLRVIKDCRDEEKRGFRDSDG